MVTDLIRQLLPWIPAVPLAGAALNAALGPRAPKAAVTAVGVGAPFATLGLALTALWSYLDAAPQAVRQTAWAWSTGELSVDVAFVLDPLSAVMLFIVTFVGALIHLYSVGYMGADEGYQRYFVYLNLFLGAMLLLVLGSNFLVLFVGWEGVGLCSYLLIGFYYRERTPPKAGRKAFIVNRIGDFAFLAAILALFDRFGTLDFRSLFRAVAADPGAASGTYALGLSFAAFVALCLFIGAMGKSAQIPLYVWLPDAMAGPTPVSALIHAATMVTAGVYMLARANVFYQLAPGVSLFVAGIGAATALLAATIGLAQTDIKKVLAYSTVSQLGYMFLAAGVGAYGVAIFHVATHAFFKALLFLGAGSVIHAMGGEQDMRRMGGLRHHLPTTYRTFLIAALAIAGIPPLAGFFSKDAILESAFAGGHYVLWGIGLLTAGLTAFYMFRALLLTFFGDFRGSEEEREHLHESPLSMTVPLWILAAGSVAAGWVGLPRTLSEHNLFLDWLAPVVSPVAALGGGARGGGAHGAEHHLSAGVEWALLVASVAVAAAGIFLAFRAYGGTGSGDRATAGPEAPTADWLERFPRVHRLLAGAYFVDDLYRRFIVRPLAWTARMLMKVVDTLVIEGVLHVGAFLTELTGDVGRFSTTGNVRNYALYFFLGLVALFGWLIL